MADKVQATWQRPHPRVQPASDRAAVRIGRVVEIVFHRNNGGHYETLTVEEAVSLCSGLAAAVAKNSED